MFWTGNRTIGYEQYFISGLARYIPRYVVGIDLLGKHHILNSSNHPLDFSHDCANAKHNKTNETEEGWLMAPAVAMTYSAMNINMG
jgi:hypothetical protein